HAKSGHRVAAYQAVRIDRVLEEVRERGLLPEVHELSSQPGSMQAKLVKLREQARWWVTGSRGAAPFHAKDLPKLRFRVVTGVTTQLEFCQGDEWVNTRTYADVFINRVTLGLHDRLLLEFEGHDHSGQAISVSGWFFMNDVYYDFGPGQLGETLVVEVNNEVSLENPLQIFNFQVEGQTAAGEGYCYDPVVLLAPVKGELTRSG
ncbi:MAG: hypothetical protein KDK70_28765, partial [Myxococcales bacterium]|nr:hypothetical protein [Myxococcales bacterium]